MKTKIYIDKTGRIELHASEAVLNCLYNFGAFDKAPEGYGVTHEARLWKALKTFCLNRLQSARIERVGRQRHSPLEGLANWDASIMFNALMDNAEEISYRASGAEEFAVR